MSVQIYVDEIIEIIKTRYTEGNLGSIETVFDRAKVNSVDSSMLKTEIHQSFNEIRANEKNSAKPWFRNFQDPSILIYINTSFQNHFGGGGRIPTITLDLKSKFNQNMQPFHILLHKIDSLLSII